MTSNVSLLKCLSAIIVVTGVFVPYGRNQCLLVPNDTKTITALTQLVPLPRSGLEQ